MPTGHWTAFENELKRPFRQHYHCILLKPAEIRRCVDGLVVVVVSAHRTSCPSAWSPACTTGRPSCSPEIWDRPRSSATTRGSWTAAAWPACASDGWSAAPASAEASSDWPPPPSRSSNAAKGCLLGKWQKQKKREVCLASKHVQIPSTAEAHFNTCDVEEDLDFLVSCGSPDPPVPPDAPEWSRRRVSLLPGRLPASCCKA